MKLFEELKWRGLIESVTSEDLEDKINNGELTFYIGTDPTAESLHIGHFSSMLTAKRLADHGHHPIILVGGGTGLIGDPRSTAERDVISRDLLNKNYIALSKQIKEIFQCEMVNNYDWYKELNFIDYLRDYGKHFNLNYMLSKETVKSRLETGISYTEFSYMILQSIDFLHLYETLGCTMQIGGQDQWGNITSGLELIRKKHGANVDCYGFTMPLITKADGTKFGKSESGSVWLDKTKTSSYGMYQFLVNSEDEKVIDYLKKLTFLDRETIDSLEEKVKTEPFKREAQKVLAKEVILFLHGQEELDKSLKITEVLFKGDIRDLSEDELKDALHSFEKNAVSNDIDLVECLVEANIASSKREAREWIKAGSIQVNGEKVNDGEFVVSKENALVDGLTVIKKGKRNYYVIAQN